MIWGLCLRDPAFLNSSPFAFSADSFESYSDNDDVSGLALGTGWGSAWIAVDFVNSFDTFEGYNDNDSVNGLNGGTGWEAAWIAG